MKKLSNQKGFTLIELLVVIAILGILAAIAIPNFSKFMPVSEDVAAEVELSNVQAAVDVCYVDTGEYPTSDGDVPGDVEWGKLVPDYMRQQPEDDYTLDENGLASKVAS